MDQLNIKAGVVGGFVGFTVALIMFYFVVIKL